MRAQRLLLSLQDYSLFPSYLPRRWVDVTGHKYVLHSMQRSARKPWFVNYAKPREEEHDCAERAAYLKQARSWIMQATVIVNVLMLHKILTVIDINTWSKPS